MVLGRFCDLNIAPKVVFMKLICMSIEFKNHKFGSKASYGWCLQIANSNLNQVKNGAKWLIPDLIDRK